MKSIDRIKDEIQKVFGKRQSGLLIEILDIVHETVKAKDFNELKAIVAELARGQFELVEVQKRNEERLTNLEKAVQELVKSQKELVEAQKENVKRINELAEAQKKTEQTLNELVQAQKRSEERLTKLENTAHELAEAQKKTEQTVNELVQAQKRSEERLTKLENTVHELAEAQKRTEIEIRELTKFLYRTRTELAGLSKSMSYAFENEVFRTLPSVLKERYGIEIEKKFIREEIGGKEINLFGKGKKDGKEIYIVGETKLRIEKTEEDIKTLLEEFEEKIEAVKEVIGDAEIMKIFVTHYAGKGFLNEAKKKGIIVIQSFEL